MFKARWAALAAVTAILALGMGCSPYESYKQLNDQNKQIGPLVKAKGVQYADPELVKMGDDVELNSIALEAYADLKPAKSILYTSAASAALRDQAKKDHDSPWYTKVWVWVTSGTGAVILGYLLMLLRGASKANPITALAGDGLAALLDLFHQSGGVAAPADLATKESLSKIIGDLRADEKYGHLVDELMAKYHLDIVFPKTAPLT